ncbi:GNAT family N-acetyltransferase [Streptosporangium sp. NPDC051023]|uniref:GNAT family N-acetyltransferase n=1 Tax=Streptosporangium sp. NPDC051023 TaxID=3155410 RepID=UPI00344F5CB5
MMRTQQVPPCPAPVWAPPGDAVEIRPARPDDEERIRRFLAGLSARTRHLRFFTDVDGRSASVVRALLAVDDRRDVLLAVAGEAVVGHVMGFTGGAADVEVAVVVTDEWQGRGIGSRLVRRLLRRASVNGARTVGMDVLGDNRKVLAMVRRLWPEAVMRVSCGTVEVTAPVEPRG